MYVHYITRSMCSCMCIIRSICLCMSIELRLNGVCHGLYASVYTFLVFGGCAFLPFSLARQATARGGTKARGSLGCLDIRP